MLRHPPPPFAQPADSHMMAEPLHTTRAVVPPRSLPGYSLKEQHTTRHLNQFTTSHDPVSRLKHHYNITKRSPMRMTAITFVLVMVVLIIVDPPFIHKSTNNNIERGPMDVITVITWAFVASLAMLGIAHYRNFKNPRR